MEFRQLGQSELNLPVVTFGAWAIGGWMWGGTDDEAAVRAIQRGIDVGVTCIDTAAIYGMGHSETVVGKAIAGRRQEVLVATKCGLRWNESIGEHFFESKNNAGQEVTIYKNLKRDSIKYECEQSLKRLGIDTIDLYQCHWPDATTPLDETMEALLELQQEGKIRAFGVSNFTTDMMRECLDTAPIASDQPPYNPLQRGIEADVLPFCVEHNVGVLAYSPIAQGLLTGKVTMDRTFPDDDVRCKRPWFQPKNRKRVLDMLEQVKPIAEGHGATLTQVFIAWVVAQKGITTALVGARNEKQVEENAKAGDLKLAGDEVALIRRLVEELGDPEP
ncbi:MAG: aldo/keto reductase [Candidatus Hydrogenedentes bacterium]|nr:aldo/keto reductase [Candidatus Hydrogenedentota bacterium]